MKKSRFSESQIVGILKEVEVGAKVNETRGMRFPIVHYNMKLLDKLFRRSGPEAQSRPQDIAEGITFQGLDDPAFLEFVRNGLMAVLLLVCLAANGVLSWASLGQHDKTRPRAPRSSA